MLGFFFILTKIFPLKQTIARISHVQVQILLKTGFGAQAFKNELQIEKYRSTELWFKRSH